MPRTNQHFGKLYEELLYKYKNCSDSSFVNSYEENRTFTSFDFGELSIDKNRGVQKIILHAYYADKLFKLNKLKEAEIECRRSLSYLQALSPQERESSYLHELMQFDLLKISYRLNKLKNANRCLLRLLKKNPSSEEYSLWKKRVKLKRRRAVLIIAALVLSVCASLAFFNLSFGVLTAVLSATLGGVLAILLLTQYKSFNQKML